MSAFQTVHPIHFYHRELREVQGFTSSLIHVPQFQTACFPTDVRFIQWHCLSICLSVTFSHPTKFLTPCSFPRPKSKKTCQMKIKFLEVTQISVVRTKWKVQSSSPKEGKPDETQIPKLEAAHVLGRAGWLVKQLSTHDIFLNHQIGRKMDTMSSDTTRG